MSTRHAVWTALAAGHLTLIALWGSGFDPASDSAPAGKLLAVYGPLSGAMSNFGYFSPEVGPYLGVTFILTDSAGFTWSETLAQGRTHEANVRLWEVSAAMYGSEAEPNTELMRSCAAAKLARHPTASRVRVRLEWHQVPTMSGYRTGQRPNWSLYSECDFARASGEAAGEEDEGRR